jgi:origin recognition complex subunit 1
LNLSTVNVFF